MNLVACTNCADSGVDPESRAPCVCDEGHALSRDLHSMDPPEPEPCYGPCADCPNRGEVWLVGERWLCWRCKELA